MFVDNGLFSLPFGGVELDRGGELRKSKSEILECWNNPASKVLIVRSSSHVPIYDGGGLAWLTTELCSSYAAEERIFLGFDPANCALFGIADDDRHIAHGTYGNLRDVALKLNPLEAAAAVEAVSLVTWHKRSPFCCACGARTEIREAGHIRRCPVCTVDHFPRADAAVIMLVSDGDRCVLGRRIGSNKSRWSTLAGFVDAGESAETAVAREVYEEVGLCVDNVVFRGSQPWPFPSSLMLAYEAHAPYGELSLNHEHSEVRWFSREELRFNLERELIAVPSGLSAGGHLITQWLSSDE